MRAFLAVIALLACLSAPAAHAGEADRPAIQGVITQQLDAFRRNDADAAYALASPGIQAAFGDPVSFLAMVAHGYLPVYRPRSAEFSTYTEEDGMPVQLVEMIGPDGLAYTARYTMERQPDGSWRISGCTLLESHKLGV